MSGPLVSVLVPTHDGERFLGEALRSALAQTHTHLEVLVGDDASTDGTPALLETFRAADPRVRVLRHETNVGAFANPVRLLEEARGEYVKFLLHDDVLAPGCVATLLAGMRSSDSVSLAFSHRSTIGADGEPVGSPLGAPLLERTGVLDGTLLGNAVLEFCRNVVGELTTCLFRRSDVDPLRLWQVDGRQLAANGDVGLWLDLLSRGRAFYSADTLSSFRLHPTQRSRDPRLLARGARDWPLLIDWGRRHGFLGDPEQERRAHAEALRTAAAVSARMPSAAEAGPALEAVFLSTARLVELGSRVPVDDDRPLADRVHGPAVLDRFTQELDVWAQPHPFALAVPAPDAAEVDATVEALRQVRAAGAADRLLIATEQRHLDRLVPLAEAALARGEDVDVELVPTDDPGGLLPAPWLAVAPPGRAWHQGRAAAVWTLPRAPR
ncbi:glycosyltransferase family 2 protein [Geodermatophilus sp. TF02-6]|uniref:glycosyltransferase family 2 protein n=1 Tax=Geodermatophilus sp. TF02-6 TaxID=2250575 RepID=UPI0013142210|nr:glycosyltransferase family 2 protein [Geodermatophilus sp. TF02-6]